MLANREHKGKEEEKKKDNKKMWWFGTGEIISLSSGEKFRKKRGRARKRGPRDAIFATERRGSRKRLRTKKERRERGSRSPAWEKKEGENRGKKG